MNTNPQSPLERAQELLRDVDVPAGARVRVLTVLEARRARASSRRWTRLAFAALAVAGTAAGAEFGGVTHFWGARSSDVSEQPGGTEPAEPRPSVGSKKAGSSASNQRAPQQGMQPPTRAPSAEERQRTAGQSDHHASRTPPEAIATRAGASAPRPFAAASSRSGPSELAQQVRAYRRAVAFAKNDDERLIRELRSFEARWPESPLNHEAEIQVIAALTRLGRGAEGRSAARRFVAEHPDSPKAQEIESALGQESDR